MDGRRVHPIVDAAAHRASSDRFPDTTIAWTLLSGESREAFRATLQVDQATWARGRGWALWKALITLAEYMHTNPVKAKEARRVIDEILRTKLVRFCV